jgi:hypothetical protein
MNNLFKSNSRFDILNHEKKEPKKEVSSQRDSSIKKIEKKTQIKTNGFGKNFSIQLDDLSCFPDLIIDKKEQQQLSLHTEEDKKSFMDIVQIQKKEEDEKSDKEFLPEGWIVLKKGQQYEQEITKEDTYIDPNVVFNRLVECYEKWKSDYIENWGIEEYEREYRFPNYDYHSFDQWDSEEDCELGEESNDDYE